MSPILESDLPLRLSTSSGSAGNSTAQPDPAASLGKYMSKTAVPTSTFDTVTGARNAASEVDYRLVFVANLHPSLTLKTATAWLGGEVVDFTVLAIAVDPTAASLIGSASAQSLTIATDTTEPKNAGASLTWASPTTAAAGLAVGDIPPGYCRGIWIRRTAVNGGATPLGDPQDVTIKVTGATAA